jgi:hypothetical protein
VGATQSWPRLMVNTSGLQYGIRPVHAEKKHPDAHFVLAVRHHVAGQLPGGRLAVRAADHGAVDISDRLRAGDDRVALVAAANTHLVYVSLATQPDCMPHLKAPDKTGSAYRAAKSVCRWSGTTLR